METKKFIFNNQSITFVLSKDNKMMINATEMAKAFGKEVAHFMENDKTKEFVKKSLNTRNSEYLKIEKEEDLYFSRQKVGTFMHRVLAIKFAAWLDVDFEIWVYSTIEKLLFGKLVQREESLAKSVKLKKEKELIEAKPNKTAKDFERYLQIERELKHEQAVRSNLTRDTINEMGDLFSEEEFKE